MGELTPPPGDRLIPGPSLRNVSNDDGPIEWDPGRPEKVAGPLWGDTTPGGGAGRGWWLRVVSSRYTFFFPYFYIITKHNYL